MGLNILTNVATKNLATAMQNRDVDGVALALQHGADVNKMSVVFPHAPNVQFNHALEIAVVCALPYRGFELLVQHGARVSTMDEGVESVRALFEHMPSDIHKHWPDAPRVKQFLLTDPVALSEPETTIGFVQTAKDSVERKTQSLAEAAGKTKTTVGGLLNRFKKS